MEREVTVDGGARVLVLHGEFDAGNEDLAARVLEAVREGNGRLVVDMVDATFADSSVVRALVAGWDLATEMGGWLRVAYTHYLIGRVIEICGLQELLPQYSSVQSALQGHVHSVPSAAADRGR